MHPVLGLLRYIPYNLILNRIISGRWGPASGTLLSAPQNVNFMPANFVAPPPILENENCVTSQCPEFYTEDALMPSQVICLDLLWLGLIVLLHPGVSIGNFTKRYLKLRWWLIINSMWIWVPLNFLVLQAHKETGHEGTTKTYDWFQKNYYWENLRLLIPDVISSCHNCQLQHPQPASHEFKLVPPQYAFHTVIIDAVGTLPPLLTLRMMIHPNCC
ncbi:hypothetical protein DSO57_1039516 [Entomophthora muscae]|uniref:Uncharacterized protein n=1 Tax=Entomophthora muscae TaxID=34485 RepID=A0ACC2U881_9FUNG|nr:hypothetical protein DSO57_1039516 [Entomophthora muscae]